MKRKQLTKDQMISLLKLAKVILKMHASDAGDRVCQDWSNEETKPEDFFSKEELQVLEYNHQIENSNLEDYNDGLHWFWDEMCASFSVADNLQQVIEELEGSK